MQGDERDVIIMSVGYGPDENGKLNQNFGPINRKDGWRRLNVAVTRARYRVEVVASFEPETLRPSASESFEHFARYLKYAKYGPTVLAQEAEDDEAVPESPFESQCSRCCAAGATPSSHRWASPATASTLGTRSAAPWSLRPGHRVRRCHVPLLQGRP
ncbi:hypothetical protein H4K36_01050 [Streptomyces sp. DHE7-1]|nr:hypothetical protein [Streptomyces sp. DHE7-1]